MFSLLNTLITAAITPLQSVSSGSNSREIRRRSKVPLFGAIGLFAFGASMPAQAQVTLMKEGFDFIQLGRSLLSDPDLPSQAVVTEGYKSRCVHCNECVATIDHPEGIHCTRF